SELTAMVVSGGSIVEPLVTLSPLLNPVIGVPAEAVTSPLNAAAAPADGGATAADTAGSRGTWPASLAAARNSVLAAWWTAGAATEGRARAGALLDEESGEPDVALMAGRRTAGRALDQRDWANSGWAARVDLAEAPD